MILTSCSCFYLMSPLSSSAHYYWPTLIEEMEVLTRNYHALEPMINVINGMNPHSVASIFYHLEAFFDFLTHLTN
jgi:hypothetical protein